MVNLDIEPDTSDLRINQHKERGNLLNKEDENYEGNEENVNKEGKEYEGSEENDVNEEDEGEDEEIITRRHLYYLFGVSEEYESEGSEGSEGTDESEDEEGSEAESAEEEEEVSEEESEEDEGAEEEDEEILHFHHLHYSLDEESEEDDKEGEESEEYEVEEILHFNHLHYLLDGASEEDEESEEWEVSEEYEGCEDDEGSEEWEGEEHEGNEQGSEDGKEADNGEDERCEASRCFVWGNTFKPHLIREEHEEMRHLLDREGEKYEKDSEEGEGGEKNEEGSEGSEEREIGEESEEDGEDERCEASPPCFKNRKRFIVRPTSEEHKDEVGEDKRCEVSGCFKLEKTTCVPRPASEEHEEDEGCEENEQGSEDDEDEIVEGHEDKESEGDEESDISDSEIHEYKEAVHKLLKYRTYKIKGPNGQLKCPFCVGKENQEYNHLLEHAVQVAEGSTESAKQRANHFAMAKYLVIDLADYVKQQPLSANKMLCNLTLEIDLRKENMDQLQSKYEEKTIAIRRILEKRDETQRTFFEEARNMLCISRYQSKRVLEQQEMLDFDFENKRQRLNSWSVELNKREAALTEEKRKMDALMREIKECQPNDELLEAGKELMKGLEDMPSHCRVKIGVKRRGGEIDEKGFMSACKKKYLPHEAETKAVELCSFWDKKTRDLEWHPFQFVEDDKGVPQKVLNENDELLRGLKDEWGDDIYSAVVAALKYNTELWNFEEDRKASHCEVIRYIFSRWKTLQCKRDEIDEVIKTLF